MQTDFETLQIRLTDSGIAVITMNRPALRNAMNTQMMQDLRDCFAQLYVEPGPARCLILTGAGDKAFCAGADLKERDGMDAAQWRAQHAIIEQAIKAIMACPLPLIAAVNGAAIGGGCELALACDFIYASDAARFALTEVTLGIIPGAMGTQNLPTAVGLRRARELVLTGEVFTAEKAQHWGMVNRLLPSDQLMDAAMAAAERIAANAPIAVRQAGKALDRSADLDRCAGYAFELEAYGATITSQDRQEGIRAFKEKRKARFTGK